MRVLVLNRRPIVEKIALWFAQTNAEVFLVTPKVLMPTSANSSDRGHQYFKEIYSVDNYDSPAVNELIMKVVEEKHIERIVSATEIDVLRAAQVRRKMGLIGQDDRGYA